METISIFNQKGGCGKSTTAINLAAYLAKHGKKTLLIDMDSQANSTVGVGINDEDLTSSVYDLLNNQEFDRSNILKVIIETDYPKLHIIPSDINLANAEITLSSLMSRETILRRILEQIDDLYQYVIIDCPPSLGLLSVNSLVASNHLIIPVDPSYFSMKGIKNLISSFASIKTNLNPGLEILGVLITKFNGRKTISKDIKEALVNSFGDKVFNTVIRIDSKIEYSQDNGKPIINYFEKCHGFKDYTSFGEEVMKWVTQKI
ncbi:AAA family ATPase [Clostridium estertheticum]|uniref:ParA family protein n=1 Tax=Clostridium estertheticum TaxID=238834 RepID=UPI001CF11CCB|nr:AAA family ATPase [Clostridium estertheticum]MCB2309031.1 AAA family ATPase [Clostridium estertheticum]MCB2346835.1 AAA family ATPase [Clostridium estertheticum]MCB2351853.1 AAA family ATPase [Clostridium estertheticum]WAG48456.1 AAA family ATPase [Clostridium estertheticum]